MLLPQKLPIGGLAVAGVVIIAPHCLHCHLTCFTVICVYLLSNYFDSSLSVFSLFFSVSGFAAPHSEQNFPVLEHPQAQVHEESELVGDTSAFEETTCVFRRSVQILVMVFFVTLNSHSDALPNRPSTQNMPAIGKSIIAKRMVRMTAST